MATKDLKFVQDIYKGKDDRNERYFLNVKAIEDNGNVVILLDHTNNSGATGAQLLRNLTNRVKNDYSELVIEEYRAFSPNSAGSMEPVQVHNILLKSNKPAKSDNQELFNMFGGFQGFINFTSEQARTKGQIDAYQDRIDELKEQKSQLLAKVGNYEAENKKLESEIRRREDQARELKYKYEDKIRDLINDHDKELRKYKGQSAIINAGVQGLGGLIMKKLNVSGADLAGFLGLESTDNDNDNSQSGNIHGSMPNVQVEPDNVDPEIRKKSDMIYSWLLKTDNQTMTKVYAIFEQIAASEQNLNDIYELTIDNVNI
jgi:hypothetical protein